MGRFTSQDPHWHPGNMIYGDPGIHADYEIVVGPDPFAIRQSRNLYEYTLNNPLNYVDLDGKCFWKPAPPIGGLGSAGSAVATGSNTVTYAIAGVVSLAGFTTIALNADPWSLDWDLSFDWPFGGQRSGVSGVALSGGALGGLSGDALGRIAASISGMDLCEPSIEDIFRPGPWLNPPSKEDIFRPGPWLNPPSMDDLFIPGPTLTPPSMDDLFIPGPTLTPPSMDDLFIPGPSLTLPAIGSGIIMANLKEGLQEVPDDWILIEEIVEAIKSEEFKDFLRSIGENPKKWRKVMEKWGSPTSEQIFQRHFWRHINGKKTFYYEGIKEYIPH